jgi:hypothetical protein
MKIIHFRHSQNLHKYYLLILFTNIIIAIVITHINIGIIVDIIIFVII